MAEDKKKEPVFKDLQAEDPDAMPQEIESMCMNCGENVRHIFAQRISASVIFVHA